MSSPKLVILIGLPGAGKTTMAEWLSDRLGFEIISRDVIRAAMFPQCRFTVAEKDAAFEAMKVGIGVAIELGRSVVTDGMCFSKEPQLEEVEAIGKEVGAATYCVHSVCEVSTAVERVRADRLSGNHVALDRDEALVESVAARFRPLPSYVFRVRSDQPIDEIGKQISILIGLEE